MYSERTDQSHLSEYRSKIETIGNGKRNFLFLPGISVLSKRTFKSISESVSQIPDTKVTFLDYAENFSQTQLQEDIHAILEQQDVTVPVGLSFGARMLTDIFLKDPHLQRKCSHLILLGPFFYLDRDSRLKSLINFAEKLPINTIPLMGNMLAKQAISRFKYDSGFLADGLTREELISEQSFRSFRSRLDTFIDEDRPNPYLFGKIDTPTTIIWWEKEVAGLRQQDEIRHCFRNLSEFTIPGNHGHTESHSDEITKIIMDQTS